MQAWKAHVVQHRGEKGHVGNALHQSEPVQAQIKALEPPTLFNLGIFVCLIASGWQGWQVGNAQPPASPCWSKANQPAEGERKDSEIAVTNASMESTCRPSGYKRAQPLCAETKKGPDVLNQIQRSQLPWKSCSRLDSLVQ